MATDAAERAHYYRAHFPAAALGALYGANGPLHAQELAIERDDGTFQRHRHLGELAAAAAAPGVAALHAGGLYARAVARGGRGGPALPGAALRIDLDATDCLREWTCYVDRDDPASCDRAWPLVALWARVLCEVLTAHFAFDREAILVDFSGRRGAHLTCACATARALSAEARAAICAYLRPPADAADARETRFFVGSALFGAAVDETLMPFFAARALAPQCEGGLGVLDFRDQRAVAVARYAASWPPMREAAAEALGFVVAEAPTGRAAWAALWADAERAARVGAAKAVVAWLLWPRVDVAVTRDLAHLAKMPFSLHPATGRVCVPLALDELDEFVPSGAPTALALADGAPPAVARLERATTALRRVAARATGAPRHAMRAPRGPSASELRARRGAALGAPRHTLTAERVLIARHAAAFEPIVHLAARLRVDADAVAELVPPGYALPSYARAPKGECTSAWLRRLRRFDAHSASARIIDRRPVVVVLRRARSAAHRAARVAALARALEDDDEQPLASVDLRWDGATIEAMLGAEVEPAWNRALVGAAEDA